MFTLILIALIVTAIGIGIYLNDEEGENYRETDRPERPEDVEDVPGQGEV